MPDQDISTMMGAASPYSPAAGPFSNVLQSGLVPGLAPQNNERPSGFMGTTGKLAFFGTKLLEGIQRGRALSYMKQETAKENEFKGQMINLGVMMQNPELTPDQRYGLQKIQGQLVQMHLGNALDQTDQQQGGGDKDKTKGKKKKDSDQPEHPADQIKGVLRNVLTGLSGGKMPETKDTTAWLNSQLAAIGNPPGLHSQMDDNLRTVKGAVSVLQQEYAKAHPESPEMPLEALRNGLQENKDATTAISNLTRLQGGDPAKAWNYIGTALQLPKPKEQQLKEQSQGLTVREQQLTVEERERENKDREQILNAGVESSTAPPEARNHTPTDRTPIPGGPPSVAPIPQAQLTPQQQAATNYAVPGSDELFGAALQFRSNTPPKGTTVFASKDGHEMTLLSLGTNRNGQPVMVQPGTYRLFNYAKAEKEGGWQLDDKQPPKVPLDKFPVYDPKTKTWSEYAKDASGRFNQLKDSHGNPLITKIEKSGDVSERTIARMIDRTTQAHDKVLRDIQNNYNRDKESVEKTNTLRGQPLSKSAKDVLEDLKKDKDEAMAANNAQFQAEASSIYQSFGIQMMVQNQRDQAPAQDASIPGPWGDYIK